MSPVHVPWLKLTSPEIISKVPREEIDAYYRKFYTPKNVTTIVVGDFNHEALKNTMLFFKRLGIKHFIE